MPQPEIQPFNLTGASDREYQALTDFGNLMRAETRPDDPQIPMDERKMQLHNIPPFVSIWVWVIWSSDGTEIIATASMDVLNMEENRHLAQFNIGVHPDHRRKGISKQLLAPVAETARAESRRLMLTGTNSRVPAGAAWMERMGANPGLEMTVNQLVLADLDHTLLTDWLAKAPARASGFTLGLWDGPYPEAQLQAITELNEVMNTAPRGDLEVDDFHFTPEHFRQMEQSMAATGEKRWTVYATEQATGKFAGFTEITWHPSRPQIISQGSTGVFPDYRSKGLGRWLKAAMLQKIVSELPNAKFVRTGNADSNAAMLSINHALGFKPYYAECYWQIDTDKVLGYLGTS